MRGDPGAAGVIASGTSAPPNAEGHMVTFLRTPILQRIRGRSVASISFVGRKTRTEHTIPVSYARDGGSLTMMSRDTRIWWRTFEENPHVELGLAGGIAKGRATPNPAAEDNPTTVRAFLEKRPTDARAYGVAADHDGSINETALRPAWTSRSHRDRTGRPLAEVTVRVPPEENIDLLRNPARACIGFTSPEGPRIEPAAVRYREDQYLVGLDENALVPDEGAEVVLVVDEGLLFFELRAVYVRGHLARVRERPKDSKTWMEVIPTKITGWDYGRMRSDHGSD